MRIPDIYLKKIYPHKELLVTSIVIVLCLALSISFPTYTAFQSISKNIFFLVILPALYIKLILKDNLIEWGWNLKNRKEGLILASLNFFSGLLIFYLFANFTTFSTRYSISPIIRNSFGFFLLYELVFFNIFFFTQEFFFKGFVLFSFRQFRHWSIFIQSSVYFILLLFSKGHILQLAPFIFLSFSGGLITYKTRSFWYSYISGLLFIIILDACLIHLVK